MTIAFRGNAAQAAEEQRNAYHVAPDGDYFLTCVDAKEKKAKSGRDMIELELVIANGEYADKTHVWTYLVFIEEGAKGHGLTLHALKAFGFPYDGDITVNAQDFIGRGVKAKLKATEYNGKPKNEVDRYYVDEEIPAPEVEPQAAADFDPEKLEKQAARATPPPPAKPAPQPATSGRKLPWGKR